MRWPVILFAALAVLLQYPLWVGKGGWLWVWKYERELEERRQVNYQLEQRNASLAAQVEDLRSGNEAIEELARFELGFTKPDELFVQVPRTPD